MIDVREKETSERKGDGRVRVPSVTLRQNKVNLVQAAHTHGRAAFVTLKGKVVKQKRSQMQDDQPDMQGKPSQAQTTEFG